MEETLLPLANVNHNQNQPTNQQRETTDQNKEQQIASAAVPDSVRRLTDGCGIISLSLFSSYKVNCAAQSILPCHAAEPCCCCWCRKKRRREKEKRSRSDKVVSLSLFFFFHFFDSRARLRRKRRYVWERYHESPTTTIILSLPFFSTYKHIHKKVKEMCKKKAWPLGNGSSSRRIGHCLSQHNYLVVSLSSGKRGLPNWSRVSCVCCVVPIIYHISDIFWFFLELSYL